MLRKTQSPYYVAQAILSRRDHSEGEMRMKLKRRQFAVGQIDDVIKKLKKLRLIDDDKFAMAYAEQTLRFKPVGPRWLAYRLRQKGIRETIITTVVSNLYGPGREGELAREAAKRWRGIKVEQVKDEGKLARYLSARGFSAEVVRREMANGS